MWKYICITPEQVASSDAPQSCPSPSGALSHMDRQASQPSICIERQMLAYARRGSGQERNDPGASEEEHSEHVCMSGIIVHSPDTASCAMTAGTSPGTAGLDVHCLTAVLVELHSFW